MNWFSFFMFLCEILIPVMMITVGTVFLKSPPKKINLFYGYRTASSMKSYDTWTFAHKYSGKLLVSFGLIMLFPSVIFAVFVFNISNDIIEAVATVFCVFQTVPFIVVIALTEKALDKNFDGFGNRKIK